MIDVRGIERTLVRGLRNQLECLGKPCEVIRQNQVAKAPPYPYLVYHIQVPAAPLKGGWSKDEEGKFYRHVKQVWQIELHSSAADEALIGALAAHEWLNLTGATLLEDAGIVVSQIEDVQTDATLVETRYDHRAWFTATFTLVDYAGVTAADISGEIGSVE